MAISDDNAVVRAAMLLPRYILMLVVFVFVGELSFMLYYDTMYLVAGRQIMLFNLEALVRGLLVVIPAAMLTSGAMLGVHRVRHSSGGVLAIAMYAALGVVTWLVMFPLLLGVMDHIDAKVETSRLPLTGGYFREYGRDTIYMSHDFETESMACVVIAGYEEASDAVSMKKVSRARMKQDAEPFSDILVKATVPTVAKWITDGFALFNKRAQNARKSGIISWLAFSSIGVLLFSSYALTFCSNWPLMSVVAMLTVYAGGLAFNALYFTDLFKFMRLWSLSMPFGNDTGLLVCINLTFALLFVLLGVLSALIRIRREA